MSIATLLAAFLAKTRVIDLNIINRSGYDLQAKLPKKLAFDPNRSNYCIMNSITTCSIAKPIEQISFHRAELGVIMSLYCRMVAEGEWRDYGISSLREVAVFSIFRRTAEYPLYRIEKRPKLRNRQGQYAVIGMDGHILKRGSDLKTVLRVLERKLIRAVE